MKKISFFISVFVIAGCSTPEIHIPSYNLHTFKTSKHTVKETSNQKKQEKASRGFFETLGSLKPRMKKIHIQECIQIPQQQRKRMPLLWETQATKKHSNTHNKKHKSVKHTKQKNEDFGTLLTKKLKMTSKKKNIEEILKPTLPTPENEMFSSKVEKKESTKKGNLFSSFLQKTTESFSTLLKTGPKVKKEYYTGGKIRSKFVMDRNSRESGLLYRYGYEGKITSTVHLKHGLKNGLETLFNTEGKILKRTPYVNGKKDGIVEVYYPNGKVLAQISYKNDIREGRASKYNQDGSINEEVEFRHGRLIIEDDPLNIPNID